MFSLKIHQPHLSFFYSQVAPPRPFISSPHLLPPLLSPLSLGTTIFLKPNNFFRSNIPRSKPTFKPLSVSGFDATVGSNGEQGFVFSPQLEDLSQNGDVYQKTLALVECSMFAALSGLVYFLSNSLAIEVEEKLWFVATTMLLLVLSGPVKALTYLLKHGIVGFTMGTLWRLGTNWGLSIFLCTIVEFAPFCLESL